MANLVALIKLPSLAFSMLVLNSFIKDCLLAGKNVPTKLARAGLSKALFCGYAGWTTEGDSAFNELSGSSPLSIRQQALRGIAKVALERGDKKGARHQYERILGKSLIGQGPPAAHWAHSEYAWLLFEDGNLEVRHLAQNSLSKIKDDGHLLPT